MPSREGLTFNMCHLSNPAIDLQAQIFLKKALPYGDSILGKLFYVPQFLFLATIELGVEHRVFCV